MYRCLSVTIYFLLYGELSYAVFIHFMWKVRENVEPVKVIQPMIRLVPDCETSEEIILQTQRFQSFLVFPPLITNQDEMKDPSLSFCPWEDK